MTSIIPWFSNLIVQVYTLVSSNQVLSAFCLLAFFSSIILIVRQLLGNR